jgi:hypothetical protein
VKPPPRCEFAKLAVDFAKQRRTTLPPLFILVAEIEPR